VKPEDRTVTGTAWVTDTPDTTDDNPEAKFVADATAFEKDDVNVIAEPAAEATLVTAARGGVPMAEATADEACVRMADGASRFVALVTAETAEETAAGTLMAAVAGNTTALKEVAAPEIKEEAGAGTMAAADDTIEAAADPPMTAETTDEAPLVSPEAKEVIPVGAEDGVQIPLLSMPRQTVADTGRMPGLTAAETPTPPGRMLPSKPAFEVDAAAPAAEVGLQMPLFKIPRHTVADTGRTLPALTAAETPTPPGRIPPSRPGFDVAAGAAGAGVAAAPAPVAAAAADVGVQIPLFKMPKHTVADMPRRPGLTAADTPTSGTIPPRAPPRRPPLEAAACVVKTDTATGAAAAVGEAADAAPAPVVYS